MSDDKKLEEFFKRHAGEDEKMKKREFRKMLKKAAEREDLKEVGRKALRGTFCDGDKDDDDLLDWGEFKKVVKELEAKGVELDLDA